MRKWFELDCASPLLVFGILAVLGADGYFIYCLTDERWNMFPWAIGSFVLTVVVLGFKTGYVIDCERGNVLRNVRFWGIRSLRRIGLVSDFTGITFDFNPGSDAQGDASNTTRCALVLERPVGRLQVTGYLHTLAEARTLGEEISKSSGLVLHIPTR